MRLDVGVVDVMGSITKALDWLLRRTWMDGDFGLLSYIQDDLPKWCATELSEPFEGLVDMSFEFHNFRGGHGIITFVTNEEKGSQRLSFRIVDDEDRPLLAGEFEIDEDDGQDEADQDVLGDDAMAMEQVEGQLVTVP